MRKVLLISSALMFIAALTISFKYINQPEEQAEVTASIATDDGIMWYTNWKEAVEAVEKSKKPMFVDLYTDWCGWCKRMDATTFKDKDVVEYMNKHFIALKFNAEQKQPIEWRGNTLKYVQSGRRGVHELAYSLLDGRLGYPSFVFLDKNIDRITISPGYKQPDGLMDEMKFIAEGHYKTKTFEEYKKGK